MRRLREYPPAGGADTDSGTDTDLDPATIEGEDPSDR